MNETDRKYMLEALALAEKAYEMGEIPVGAVVVNNEEIVGRGCNYRENGKRATAHAELIAIEEACSHLGSWRLSDCTLYVTMEPCPMCAGALINSRIKRVVYGCKDSVSGACGSVVNLNAYPFNHSFILEGEVLGDEARELLRAFFKERRRQPSEK